MILIKKSVGNSSLKLALVSLLICVASISFANSKAQFQFQTATRSQNFDQRNSDGLPVALNDSKIGHNVESYSNFKRAGNVHSFYLISNFEGVRKKSKLLFNFSHFIVASLDVATIIFPFHSFL